MKKALAYISVAVLALSSCQTMVNTAHTVDAQSNIRSITVADLNVADKRVTATISPVSSDLRRGGEKNVKQAVENKALAENATRENGPGDLLLDPQYVVTKKKGLFGNKITSISVSGRPAWYKNFRSLDDSIWNNPAYRQVVPAKTPLYGRSKTVGAPVFQAQRQKTPAFRPKGWHGNVDLYIGGGTDEKHDNTVDFSYIVTANYGYQFSPYFYLGLGTGYTNLSLEHVDDSYQVIPVFYDFRFNTSRKANTWFIDFKLGSAIPVGDWTDELEEFKEIVWVVPSIGYSWGNVDLSAYFMHHELEAEYNNFGYSGKVDFEFNTWGLKLGLRF